MEKAIFLDRDGVINNPSSNYYVFRTSQFLLNPTVIQRLIEYQQAGYLLIIISNQGGISKGLYSKLETDFVHQKMLETFEQHSILISEIYYCPHHDSIENCLCRKPQPLMLQKALARFNISAQKSILIGDSIRDIEAAKNANITGFLIKKNAPLPNLPQILSRIRT